MMHHRHCIHYNGRDLLHGAKLCGAGVDPVEISNGGVRLGWYLKAPCSEKNADAPTCPHREFPTWEQMAESRARLDKMAEGVLKLVRLIPETGSSGTVQCPTCNELVDWSRSGYNGHKRASCRTEGCLAFME